MGCTSDEPYLSLDTAYSRIYARIMNKELKNANTELNNQDTLRQIFMENELHSPVENDKSQEFNLLFKTKYEFKYDEFDKLLGNTDWDTYIDNIYEKRRNYLREVNMITSDIINANTYINPPKIHSIEEIRKIPIKPIDNKEKNAAAVKPLIEIYNFINDRVKKTYKSEFMMKLKTISNNSRFETNEIITISSEEEDGTKIPNDDKIINTENWIFQYQDARLFGIDTEEKIIEEENKITEYKNWIILEIDRTDDKEYKLSLVLQLAYIKFKPNNGLESISFGIEIYKILQNTKFEKYIKDIVIFYTNFNLEQVILLEDYKIFKNDKLNGWLTKEIKY